MAHYIPFSSNSTLLILNSAHLICFLWPKRSIFFKDLVYNIPLKITRVWKLFWNVKSKQSYFLWMYLQTKLRISCELCSTSKKIWVKMKIPGYVQKSTGSSLTLAKMLRAEKRKQQAKMNQKNYRQSLNKKIFWAALEGCWK